MRDARIALGSRPTEGFSALAEFQFDSGRHLICLSCSLRHRRRLADSFGGFVRLSGRNWGSVEAGQGRVEPSRAGPSRAEPCRLQGWIRQGRQPRRQEQRHTDTALRRGRCKDRSLLSLDALCNSHSIWRHDTQIGLGELRMIRRHPIPMCRSEWRSRWQRDQQEKARTEERRLRRAASNTFKIQDSEPLACY